MKNNNITNEQHERLCAYLFGELEGDERASFETELGASAELTEEKARIEASMNLVREFAPEAPVALSEGMRATLAAAAAKAGGARPGPKLAWYNHPGLQVAAATVVAVFAFRALDSRLLDNGFGVRSASPESENDVAVRGVIATPDEPILKDFRLVSTAERFRKEFAGVGYLDENGTPKKSVKEGMESLGYLDSSSQADAEIMAGLGYVDVTPSTAPTFEPPAEGGLTSTRGSSAQGAGGPTVSLFKQEGGSQGRFVPGAGRGTNPAQPGKRSNGSGDIAKAEGESPFAAPLLANQIYEVDGPGWGGGQQYYLGTTDGQVSGEYDFGAAPEIVAELEPVTEAEVEEAKEELARFEVDAKARKKGLLSSDVAAIGSGLADLNESLEALELAAPSAKWDADKRIAMGGSSDMPAAAGRVTAETLDGAPKQADDFFAGLKLRLADGSVDMPAARARLVQLEEAEVADKLRNIVEDEDEEAGLSDDEKVTLKFLRGYIEDADQAELRAERDRINAERRRAIEVEREYLTILQRCVPRAGEKPSAMYYRYWGDNGFEFPIHDALSTFAVDVDTASYTLARRYLQDGYLPERAQIRTEEFVNYATPDLAAPTNGDVFGVSMELAPSPFGPSAEDGGEHMMLRVGVRGMEVDKSERDPVALTFVVDVSGSMKTDNRLELVKHSLRLLVGELRPTDSIALITFNNTATRVLDMTSVGNGAAIERALYDMRADGGTNAEAGLTLGFAEAVVAHTQGAQNRVVFLSDGVGNIGETNENQLLEDARRAREKGIYLNTIGFGMTNHNDRFLEQLANGGDGLCNYVDSPDEAQRALVDNFTGAFQTIARDVKIQVEFDKNQVLSYRQLGYENRAIADSDFRNDKVDAGEIGAGHQVVALYEIVLRDAVEGSETPLATTRVRYKAPYGQLETGAEDSATEIESFFYRNSGSGQFDGASIGFQKSALAAQFAEFLRRSSHAKGDSVSLLRYRLEELAKTTNDPELIELSALVQLAQPQLEPALLVENQIRRRADELQRFEYECQSQTYLDDNTTDEWLAKTTATRSQLREELRREVYGAYGLEH